MGPKYGINIIKKIQKQKRIIKINSSEAHYSTCMLLAGILLKMRAYGLVRINMELLSHAHSIFSLWLIIVGAIQIIYTASTSFGHFFFKKKNSLFFCISYGFYNYRNLLYKRYGTQRGHLANEQQSPANQVTSSPSSSPGLLANLVSREKLVFPASHFFSRHQWFIFFRQSHSSCDPLTAPPMILYSSKQHPSSVQSNSSLLMHFLCPTDSSSLTMATCHQPTMMISSNL